MKNLCSTKKIPRILGIAVPALCGIAPAAAQQPYKILDHWKIGGSGSWDYLTADPAAHLLYLAHGPRVEVIDTQVVIGRP